MWRRRFLASGPLLSVALAVAGCSGSSSTPAADAGADIASSDRGAVADVAADAPVADDRCLRTSGRPAEHTWARFDGPRASVEVYRDALGVPHLYATTDADLFFASGYMQAVDRLFQMELMRRGAAGTLAEVLGPEKLRQDQLVRLVDLPRWSRESTDRLQRESPEVYALVVAWVAGVNRRVDEIRAGTVPLPPGFRRTEFDFMPARWTPDDPIAVSRLVLFQNANQLEYDILASIVRRYVPQGAGLPIFQSLNGSFILPEELRPQTGVMSAAWPDAAPWPFPEDAARRMRSFSAEMAAFRSGGSNNWAVDGRHSANGRPLVAGDPHQPLQSPSVFWAQHMNSAEQGGSFDVMGFSFVGTPLVQLGHSRTVAWTATTSYPDMMDLFDVEVEAGRARLGEAYEPVRRCVERIAVRGREPVDYVVEEIPGRGVLLPADFTPVPLTGPGNRLMLAWTGFAATNEAAAFMALNRARNVEEFDRGVDRMELGAFNFIAADRRDISYRTHVTLPDRGDPRTMLPAHLVLDANNPRALWTGQALATQRFPAARNPAQGFLASANNDPFGFTHNGRTDDDPWYFGVWFDPGSRAQRIESELTRLVAAGGVTVPAMQALQLDTHNVFADELLPTLTEALARVPTDPALAAFRAQPELATLGDLLSRWDRTMDRTSSPAVVYEAWQNFFARRVLADDLTLVFDAVLSAEPAYVLKLLALTVRGRFAGSERFLQGGVHALALGALADTHAWLVQRFGGAEPSRYRWDRFHRTRIAPSFSAAGPFATEPVTTDGSVGTVNVSQALFFDGATPREHHESRSGAVYRMVMSFDEDGTPAAVVNFPRGNAGDPTSPWWSNTQADWQAGVYRPMPFRRDAVVRAAQETLTVRP